MPDYDKIKENVYNRSGGKSKMQKKKGILLFILFFTLLFAVNVPADLGNFNDYDSDSGWDSSDWNSNSYGNYDDDDDDDYYYSSRSSRRSGGGGGTIANNGVVDLLFAAVVVVVIIVTTINAKNKQSGTSTSQTSTVPNGEIPDNSARIVPEIIKSDPNFSDTKFMGWAKEVFIALQTAWSKRDFDAARPFEKEELYRQHQQQIQSYIDNGRINVIDRININNAHFFEYKRDNQYEYITVYMQTRMTDYIKDEKTGQVLKGDPNKDCYPRYLLTFMRKNGVKTDPATSNKSTTNCPNCGAPCQITSSGKCEYCDSVITTGEFDWVLSDIQGVKRNSNYGSGGVFINETHND